MRSYILICMTFAVLCVTAGVVRGQQLSGTFELSDADVTFTGANGNDRAGFSVASAGDVNGDGLDDVLIGAYAGDPNGVLNAGETYLIYGHDGVTTLSGEFDLANADVTFNGIDAPDYAGYFVSSAGDVNGDDLDDILIGAYRADPGGNSEAGETYLVYGRDGGATLSGAFDLANADVQFNGIDAGDHSGRAVAPAGDVNGDGLDDLLISAFLASPDGNSGAGETYLIYGRDGVDALSGTFDLATADVTFHGVAPEDSSGRSVASAGDVNGDGLADLLISAYGADPNGTKDAGVTYLIYGRDGMATLTGTFDLATADVTFNGIDEDDRSGRSVSSAGDINGDGLDDLLIGVIWGDPNADADAGEAYLFYGRDGVDTLSGDVDLAGADATFEGIDAGDNAGRYVSSAGDVNGDGLDDLLISAWLSDPNGESESGETYLIYGRNGAATILGVFDLADADATFNGVFAGDHSGVSVASAGDVNGDGLDELLIGADMDMGGRPGATYLMYGRLVVVPGDANGDLQVDGTDYLLWAGAYGDDPAEDPPGPPLNGDFNYDGRVDGLDYLLWAANFGMGPNDARAVPEPDTWGLLLFGFVCGQQVVGGGRSRRRSQASGGCMGQAILTSWYEKRRRMARPP